MIKTILLVPEDSDPRGLLKGGPCGAQPPTMWLHRGKWGRVRLRGKPEKEALALAYEGKPLPSGCLAAISWDMCGLAWLDVLDCVERTVESGPVGWWPPELIEHGTILLIDEDGQEVKHAN